ncbi:MAG: hypothetical protein GX787_07375 [Tissierellia bacterium]|nr:hypothetical protein [Tissierellia bacterium]
MARYDAGIVNQKQSGLVVVEPIIVASRGRNPNNPSDRTTGSPTVQRLEPNSQGITNTLTTVQKDNLVLEPAILTPKRTEYGKSIRKDYESGKIQESRHNMTELQPREDGISNTLTTVQKDNLVLEKIVCEQRTDEGLRFFKGGVVGTLRTIDSCGDKRVLEKTNELLVVGNTVPSEHTAGRVFDTDGISPTVMHRNSKVVQILEEEDSPNELQLFTNLSGGKWDKIHESARRVCDEEGIAPTIPTCGGGNIEPKVAIREATKKTYLENAIEQIIEKNNGEIPDAWDLYNKNPINNGISKTLSADCGHTGTAGATAVTNYYLETEEEEWARENEIRKNGGNAQGYRVRKLTPKECWRLMGFTDEDYHKARQALEDRFYNGKDRSNSQMYKMAGNSIVVDVLEGILKNLKQERLI